MSNQAIDHLRSLIRKDRVVPLIGTGVSAWSTDGAAITNWAGLIEHAIDYALAHGAADRVWATDTRELVARNSVEAFIAAANRISSALAAPGGAAWTSWLNNGIGGLGARRRELLVALGRFAPMLLTTNYDTLAEQVLRLPIVTWRNRPLMHKVIVGDDAGVVHLHGVWEDPQSVVFDDASYAAVTGDPFADAMIRSLAVTKSLLFVGVGAGLADPNFSRLRNWMKTWRGWAPYAHFRLLRSTEFSPMTDPHDAEERLLPIAYGTEFDDLPRFLADLTTIRVAATPTRATHWRMLHGARVPLASRRDDLLLSVIQDYVLAAIRACKEADGMTRFRILCAMQVPSMDEVAVLRVWSYKPSFIEEYQQSAELVIEYYKLVTAGESAEAKRAVRERMIAFHSMQPDDWESELVDVELSRWPQCIEFSVDPIKKRVSVVTQPLRPIDPAEYENHVTTTDELFDFIASCGAVAPRSVVTLSLDKNVDLIPLFIDVLDRRRFSLARIRVDVNDEQRWRYVSPEYEEESGDLLPVLVGSAEGFTSGQHIAQISSRW